MYKISNKKSSISSQINMKSYINEFSQSIECEHCYCTSALDTCENERDQIKFA